MPKIMFVSDAGCSVVRAELGQSVMHAAKAQILDGIDADCVGHCTCATCHVYIDDDARAVLAPAGEDEIAMLECAGNPLPCSPLACQIQVTDELEGMTFRIPPRWPRRMRTV